MASGEVRYHRTRSREEAAMELTTLRTELDQVCVFVFGFAAAQSSDVSWSD